MPPKRKAAGEAKGDGVVAKKVSPAAADASFSLIDGALLRFAPTFEAHP